MPASLRALAEGGHLLTNKEVPVPLSNKMMADVLKRGLLHLFSDCKVDLVSAILAFASASEVG